MRQVQITGPGNLRVVEAAPPRLTPGWARLRMVACGVCRTDSHLLDGSILPPGAGYPLVPGHEVAAVVTEIAGPAGRAPAGTGQGGAGPGGTGQGGAGPGGKEPGGNGVAVGDLVLPHLLAPCGTCPACRSGQEQRCERCPVLGIQAPGGLADELTWPASRLVSAAGLDPVRSAVLPDAGATAYHALRIAAVPHGGVLFVTGAGGVGSHVLQLARALDPSVRLAAVVRSAATAHRLAALGIPAVEGLTGAAKRLRGQAGQADAVIDFSGSPQAPAEAVRMLRPGGRLVLGSVVRGDLHLGWIAPFASREITVTGVYSSTLEDLRQVVALARGGALDLTGSVTHSVPLDRAGEAFRLMERRPPGMVRVVVESGT
jgi:D-arabinose 1-dehydrogenase-like Zn-dependent alcohol dehydrogenase